MIVLFTVGCCVLRVVPPVCAGAGVLLVVLCFVLCVVICC